MAVFTHLNEQDVIHFLEGYDLGEYQKHQGIMQGVENSNFHLWTSMGRYILTIFEARIDRDSLPYVFNLQDHLRERGIHCPSAINDRNGLKIADLKGKPAAISSFLTGQSLQESKITPEQSMAAGRALADMHIASHDFPMTRKNPVYSAVWRDLYNKVRNKLDVDADSVVTDAFEAIEGFETLPLPSGAIHADYFPDNVFFDDGQNVCGVIDFYFSCTGFFAYDLAMAMNAWPHADMILKGYESDMPLTDIERDNLGALRKAAALRILMTRFYDWYYTPDEAEITPKNPQEYLEKLRKLL